MEDQKELIKVTIHRALQYVSTLLLAIVSFFLVRLVSKIDSMETALQTMITTVAVNTKDISYVKAQGEQNKNDNAETAGKVAVIEGDVKAINVKVFQIPPHE